MVEVKKVIYTDTPKVLVRGGDFRRWRSMLEIKLAQEGLLGYVFHNMCGAVPALPPVPSKPVASPNFVTPLSGYPQIRVQINPLDTSPETLLYLEKLDDFLEKDMTAYYIIIARLDTSIIPYFGCDENNRKTAKELMDHITLLHRPITTAADVHKATRALHPVHLKDNDVQSYNIEFLQALLRYNAKADGYCECTAADRAGFALPSGYLELLYVGGSNYQLDAADFRRLPCT